MEKEKEKYTIHAPSDVWREVINRRSVFTTDKTYNEIIYSKEYRKEMSKARASRKNVQHSVPGAESPVEDLRLASKLLYKLAKEENAVLEIMSEWNKVTEETEENLQRCKKNTIEALATFL